MKFKHLTFLTAAIALCVGLFLLLRMDLAMDRYGISYGKIPRDFLMTFWKLKGLAQMYGAVLMGFGILAWSVSTIREPALQRKLSIAFLLSLLWAGMISLAGHIAFWETTFSATLTALFFLLAAGYGWLIFYPEKLLESGGLTPEILRERWALQIGETAAQQERNRLARELHDSIKQQLFSIQVGAATMQARWDNDTDGARMALEDLRLRTRDAMTEMEALLQNLRPTPLANFGLVEALRRECEALGHRTGAKVDAQITELPDELDLPPGTAETVFRITQEAFSNIARHARAQHISLQLDRTFDGNKDAVRLRIQDDGVGFSAAQTEGMGLGNMRVRAAEHGGTLQVESFPSHGTKLCVMLPLEPLRQSDEKRELILAFLFAVAAFLGPGVGITLNYRFLANIMFGMLLFGLSAAGYFLAARRFNRLEQNQANSFRQVFELRLEWHYGLALWVALFLFSVIRWLVLVSGTTHSKVILQLVWGLHLGDFINGNPWKVAALWAVPLAVVIFGIHRLIKRQAAFYSAVSYAQYLKKLWTRYSLYFLAAILTAEALFVAYPVKGVLLLHAVLLTYWLHLSWQCLIRYRVKAEVLK